MKNKFGRKRQSLPALPPFDVLVGDPRSAADGRRLLTPQRPLRSLPLLPPHSLTLTPAAHSRSLPSIGDPHPRPLLRPESSQRLILNEIHGSTVSRSSIVDSGSFGRSWARAGGCPGPRALRTATPPTSAPAPTIPVAPCLRLSLLPISRGQGLQRRGRWTARPTWSSCPRPRPTSPLSSPPYFTAPPPPPSTRTGNTPPSIPSSLLTRCPGPSPPPSPPPRPPSTPRSSATPADLAFPVVFMGIGLPRFQSCA